MIHAHSIFRMFVIFIMMVCNCEKDELVCPEELLMDLYQNQSKSRKQRNVWKQIADHLSLISTGNTFFSVNAHAVNENFALLINRQAQKEKSKLKQSGISPEDTPIDETI